MTSGDSQRQLGADLAVLAASQFGPQAVLALRATFLRSRHPMLITDDQRRLVAGNSSACELLGVALEDFPWTSLDGFTAPNQREAMEESWRAFLSEGGAEGWYTATTEDAKEVSFEFSATANVLPGRHLFIWIPPEEEPDRAATQQAWRPVQFRAGDKTTLTDRERVVLSLLAEGLRTGEVAERLYLSPETIKTHIGNAMNKLGAHTRARAVGVALMTAQIPWEG